MSHPSQAMWVSMLLGASGVMIGIVAILSLAPRVETQRMILIALSVGMSLAVVALVWGAFIVWLDTAGATRVLIALLAVLGFIGIASWFALWAVLRVGALVMFDRAFLDFSGFTMGPVPWALRVVGTLALGALLVCVALIPTVPPRARGLFFTALMSGVVAVSLQIVTVILLALGSTSAGVSFFAATMLIALVPTFAASAVQNWAIESQR